jgi:hypothetical protein
MSRHAVFDQFRNPADLGGDHRLAGGHRLHQHDRHAFREGGQHQRIGRAQGVGDGRLIEKAGEPDRVAMVPGHPFELWPVGPVAHQRQPQPRHRLSRRIECVQKHPHALDGGQPPDEAQVQAVGVLPLGAAVILRDHAAMDDLQLRPVFGVGEQHRLGPGEVADAEDEARPRRLFREMPAHRIVDFGRTVQRVGEIDIRQGGGKHRDIGRTVGEMIVQMVDPVLQQMPGEHGGFREVEELPQQTLQTRPARCQRQPQGSQVPARPAQRGALRGDKRCRAPGGIQDIEGLFGFRAFLRPQELRRRGLPDRTGRDREAQPPQHRDFTQDEGMRNGRVVSRQIGHPWQSLRRVFRHAPAVRPACFGALWRNLGSLSRQKNVPRGNNGATDPVCPMPVPPPRGPGLHPARCRRGRCRSRRRWPRPEARFRPGASHPGSSSRVRRS